VEWLTQASSEELKRLVSRDEFFWLDLTAPTSDDVQMLVDEIGLDPEAAARALDFDRTPQLHPFSDHVGMVFYGGESRRLLEVHIYVSGRWVVTLHEPPSKSLDDLRADLSQREPPAEETVVGSVLNALASSFDDLVDPVDEELERIESQAVAVEEGRAEPGNLRREILVRRSRALHSLRIVRHQRDYIDRAVDELSKLPGLQPSQHHELRDVSMQMVRVADSVADALNRLAGALDLLNSSVANRTNMVVERLTVVATIFLPLTALTGFFGMNFGWMVNHITSLGAFLGLGVVLIAASGVGTYIWVRSRLERTTSG
jgi:magnesium transporter